MDEALPDLIAQFSVKRRFFRKETIEAHLFSLDQFSCVLKTDKIFELGDSLQLDLILAMPFENIHLKGVSGLVTERRKYCSNFFYSIDFKRDSASEHPAKREQLLRILDVVSKKQTLRSRRVAGRPVKLGGAA
ncbi:hypothetical protein [Marinobacter sp. X15-166B]|uniref:hypothetical protein n=1 Tax=Marinobacter sp. X15-166B TaxID=1897620 RepID=UPI00085BB0C1|nr:hypothetical protein [Marinobacter sp. X15-166B]OEY67599.1 hypothetical protein BG841_14930 [Marinobacter sp. X15-166B]